MSMVTPARSGDNKPVNHLPFELWARIFLLTASDTEEKHVGVRSGQCLPLIISHVCTRWREISISVPFLWNTIDTRLGEHLNALFLRRSQQTPLHIYLHALSKRELRLDGLATSPSSTLPDSLLPDHVALRVQKLSSPHAESWSTLTSHLFTVNMPLPYTSLTHLSLYCFIGDQESYIRHFLQFLRGNSALESLDFLGCMAPLIPEDYLWDEDAVVLGHLRRVAIRAAYAEPTLVRSIITNITIPPDSTVCLELHEPWDIVEEGLFSLLSQGTQRHGFLNDPRLLQFEQNCDRRTSLFGGNDVSAFGMSISEPSASIGDLLSKTLTIMGRMMRCDYVTQLWLGPIVNDSEWLWGFGQEDTWLEVLRHLPALELLSLPVVDGFEIVGPLSALSNTRDGSFPCSHLSTLHIFVSEPSFHNFVSEPSVDFSPLLQFVTLRKRLHCHITTLSFHIPVDISVRVRDYIASLPLEQFVDELTYDTSTSLPRECSVRRRLYDTCACRPNFDS